MSSTASNSQTMRALRLHPDLTIHHDSVPITAPTSTQLLIRVNAAAITRSELTWRETMARSFPIPGHDVSGTVVFAPPTSKFKARDTIFGLLAFDRDGAAADYAAAVEEELSLKPKNLSFEEAAAIPLSALTAWQALFEHGQLKPRMRLLVTAAGGGVGVMGVQLGKVAGAYVIGTCSAKNVESTKNLGADLVVDYGDGGFDSWATDVAQNREVRGVDLVFDCIGGQTLRNAFSCVKKGGAVISIAEPIQDDWNEVQARAGNDIKRTFFVVKPDGRILDRIRLLVEDDAVKAIVDRIVELEQGQEAFDILERGHTKGKIVIKVQD